MNRFDKKFVLLLFIVLFVCISIMFNNRVYAGAETIKKGDLDQDDSITILDVRLLLQAYINAGSGKEWTNDELSVMDLNDDNTVDILDVRLLLQIYINQGNEPVEISVTGFSLNKKRLQLLVGEEETLIPSTRPDNISNQYISWDSGNEGVATVDSTTGKVKALTTGTAKITAQCGELSSSCDVTVVDETTLPDPSKLMEVHFLDVNGDATFIRTPDVSIMVDGGTYGSAKKVIKYLKNLGVTKIDYYIGSHGHPDHVGAAWPIIKEFDVNKVIVSSATLNYATESELPLFEGITTISSEKDENGYYDIEPISFTIKEILRIVSTYASDDLEEAKEYFFGTSNRIRMIDAKESAVKIIDKNGLTMRCLAPMNPFNYTKESPYIDDYKENNQNSLILRLRYGDKTFLLCGDAGSTTDNVVDEITGEVIYNRMQEYLDILETKNGKYYLNVDVYKNGHHHSAKTEEVINAIRPIYTVLQSRDNDTVWPQNMPMPTFTDLLNRVGKKIYITSTKQDGNVVFITDGKDFVNDSPYGSIVPDFQLDERLSGTYKEMKQEKSIKVSGTTYFYAIITPVDAQITDATWTISNDNVSLRKVDCEGKRCLFKGRKVGTTEVTFTAKVDGVLYTATGTIVVTSGEN